MRSISAFWRGRVVALTGDKSLVGHVTGLSRNAIHEPLVIVEFEDRTRREIHPDNLFFPA